MGSAGREATGSSGIYGGPISIITVKDGRSLRGPSSLRGTSSLGVTRKGVLKYSRDTGGLGGTRSLGGGRGGTVR